MSKIAKRAIGPVHHISDANKLLWERYYNAMQAAASGMNTAIKNTENILASIILEREGFSTETHVFDIDKLRIVPRPNVKGNGNA